MHILHKWSNWTEIESLAFQYRLSGVPIGSTVYKDIQTRTCTKCGKSEKRIL